MDKFEKQRTANILAFLTAQEYVVRKNVLEKLCRAFSGTNVVWALSMSSALFFRGIVDDFRDFDLLISLSDVEDFERVFKSIGGKVKDDTVQKPAFSSPYYKEAELDGISFDLIGDMTVNTFGKSYCYILKDADIQYRTLDTDIGIPLSPVQANYLLYAMMVGWQKRREFKKNLCYEYLCSRGKEYMQIFEELMVKDNVEKMLPADVIKDVKKLLTQQNQ